MTTPISAADIQQQLPPAPQAPQAAQPAQAPALPGNISAVSINVPNPTVTMAPPLPATATKQFMA